MTAVLQEGNRMLDQETLVAFMATSNPAAARAFFEGVLGLTFVEEHEPLVVFRRGNLLSLSQP
jgi:catechol 2,3-dioxygenase-like lactoylglutathione lyase family enzyme